jgi:hypothetical protein
MCSSTEAALGPGRGEGGRAGNAVEGKHEQLHRPHREGLDASAAVLQQLQQLCLVLLRARRRRACWRWPGRRACQRQLRAAWAGGNGVPQMHGEGYPLPDCKNEGSTLLIMC